MICALFMEKDQALLKHIRDAIALITTYTSDFDRAKFLLAEHKLIQDGVVRELESCLEYRGT